MNPWNANATAAKEIINPKNTPGKFSKNPLALPSGKYFFDIGIKPIKAIPNPTTIPTIKRTT